MLSEAELAKIEAHVATCEVTYWVDGDKIGCDLCKETLVDLLPEVRRLRAAGMALLTAGSSYGPSRVFLGDGGSCIFCTEDGNPCPWVAFYNAIEGE